MTQTNQTEDRGDYRAVSLDDLADEVRELMRRSEWQEATQLVIDWLHMAASVWAWERKAGPRDAKNRILLALHTRWVEEGVDWTIADALTDVCFMWLQEGIGANGPNNITLNPWDGGIAGEAPSKKVSWAMWARAIQTNLAGWVLVGPTWPPLPKWATLRCYA